MRERRGEYGLPDGGAEMPERSEMGFRTSVEDGWMEPMIKGTCGRAGADKVWGGGDS